VESPQPFTAVPASWTPINGGEALAVGGNGSYIAVTNRADKSDGVALGVTGMQVDIFYKVGAYIKATGSTNEKIRLRFNFNDADFKCAAIVSVIQANCYTLVLGGITGPSQNAPLNNVKLEITGNSLPGNATSTSSTSPPFEIDVYSVAVVGVNRTSWLADVQRRTDLVRKRDVLVRVTDGFGNPVPNASVAITQLQQTFPFGSDLNDDAYNDTAYRNWFASKWGGGYSWTAYTDALKWYSMQPEQGNTTYERVVNLQNWCNNNSISVRGHTIIWDDEPTIQTWLKQITDPTTLFGYMQTRVNEVVTTFKNSIDQWDPSNEILHKTYFSKALGYDVRPWYFNATKALDPTAQLFLSDYNMVEACDDAVVWPEAAMDFVTFLRQQGGPVDAFAVQGQFTQVTPYLFRYALDKLGQFGIPIWMSEINLRLTVDPYSEQSQRDFMELILREAYAHPAVSAMLLSQTWNPQRDWDENNGTCPGDKCLYNLDFSPRLVGNLWEDLYYREWMTQNVTGSTNANGEFAFRGFAGKYGIAVNGSGNATYNYQTSAQFIVHPLNTTIDPNTYLFELSTPYVTFINGSVAPNATSLGGSSSNVTSTSANGPFANVSSTLDVSTPYINLAQGTADIASSIAHVERPVGSNSTSTFRIVPGSAPDVINIVAPLTPLGRYPVVTIPTPTVPPNAIGPIPTGAMGPSSGGMAPSPQSGATPSPSQQSGAAPSPA
jgi:GH35 family endo-1,4-beta-xylanase